MIIDVEPILFRIGSLPVRWLTVLWLIGASIGLLWWLGAVRDRGVDRRVALDLLSWTIPAAILGARLFHILASLDYYVLYPADVADLTRGGLSLWGAIVGGGLAAALAARARGLSLAPIADPAAPAMALAEAIGRLGCLIDGSSLGTVTDAPWGVVYVNPDTQAPDHVATRHPTPLYHALAALLICGLLRTRRAARLAPGRVFAIWLALHALSRLTIGFLRLEPSLLLGLQLAQWLSIAALVGVGFVMIRARRQSAATSLGSA